MIMEGSTCRIITHRPTDNDLHECQNINLSDEFDWDPSNNLFKMSSMEEEYRTSSNFHRYINIFESRFPCAPPIIHCRYDLGIHEFNRTMENVSIGLAHDFMVDILISKVRNKRTRSGFATYTYKQHNRIRADILARKWGIGLDKENWNLKYTTKDNVISSLKPLMQS